MAERIALGRGARTCATGRNARTTSPVTAPLQRLVAPAIRLMLLREKESVDTKLLSFSGFGKKRSVLEEERNLALKSLAPAHSAKVRKIAEEFKNIEEQWNSLTEDAMNMDEGIFYLVRNVDYLKSSRAFLITAKGSFDIESWVDNNYGTDLFRHSNVK